MRNALTVLLLLCLASPGYSQNFAYHVTKEDFESAWASLINHDYLDRVQDSSTPELVRVLENEAARYDLEKTCSFHQQNLRRVLFTHAKGRMIAIYDHRGKILRSYEKYKGISLPQKIIKEIINDYPGWKISDSTYRVNYLEGKDEAKKSYKIEIEKAGAKKVINWLP